MLGPKLTSILHIQTKVLSLQQYVPVISGLNPKFPSIASRKSYMQLNNFDYTLAPIVVLIVTGKMEFIVIFISDFFSISNDDEYYLK